MKNQIRLLTAALLCLCFVPAQAQPGGRMGGMMSGQLGPQWSAAISKLFGDNPVFTATMETQTKVGAKEGPMTMTGKTAFDNGKFRMEMDLNSMLGQMRPGMGEQMKAMGMDLSNSAMISRPDKKVNYTVYPGMKAYIETAMQDPDETNSAAEFKIELTELGKETVDGHPCVKTKAVVTNDKGKQTEYTIWKATDMGKFPIQIETTQRGNAVTMRFKDVKLSRPDAALFELPSDFQRFDNMPAMMQQQVMKQMGTKPPQ